VIARAVAPLTPAQAAGRVAAGANAFWLASPGVQEDIAVQADFVGCDPVRVLRGSSVDELEAAWADERRAWAASSEGALPEGLPIGVGWLSYDLARQWMRLPSLASDEHDWADIGFHFYDAVWCWDHRRQQATILARDEGAAGRLAARLAVSEGTTALPTLGTLAADQPDERYLTGVRRILDYLLAGDAYQVNLARRLSAPLSPRDALAVATLLRARVPAPHGLFLVAGDAGAGAGTVVGNSPERFLRCDGRGAVETRPIKGTRPRTGVAAADELARRELQASPKDRAEHVMIVDLERNDLGRVCQSGSVVVEGLARVMDLPTVFHLVSTVRGTLRPEVGLAELLRATFPGGSVTGAPKQRAMEIIEELEPFRRGPYTGATGWLGATGDLDLAVAIRTALVRERLTLSVGGGIVADSTPEAELAETTAKAAAFAALGTVRTTA
jgi:para-aminobenzoate synthetase component 1